MKKKVFISYSKYDADSAQKICNELEGKGFGCFIFERDVKPLEDFAETIVDAINNCRALILVFSEKANKSKHVLREVKLADNNDIPIFTIRIENAKPSKSLEYFFVTNQWLDAYEKPLEKHFNKIISTVIKLFGEEETNNNPVDVKDTVPVKPPSLQSSFRNPFEDNVEYIKIPGGTYKYSVSGKIETVPGLYFCKYPVTNKRYNRFISYLEGNEKELEKTLPLNMFVEKLSIFSESNDGFRGYLGNNWKAWNEKLRSKVEDKEFKGDDQPVVGVTWHSARSYCFWLSCLDAVLNGDSKLEDVLKLAHLYRLPTEIEWVWAGYGNPDGSIREYPWPNEKGEPNPKLANYVGNVGATTPVGRYPEGATPRGLMDMAGNVWEWVENDYDSKEKAPALRGGSWGGEAYNLRCFARLDEDSVNWDSTCGFRVARST